MSRAYQRVNNRDNNLTSGNSSSSSTNNTSTSTDEPIGAGRRYAQSESFQRLSTKVNNKRDILIDRYMVYNFLYYIRSYSLL